MERCKAKGDSGTNHPGGFGYKAVANVDRREDRLALRERRKGDEGKWQG
jgi:hypothetical protein